MMNFKDIENVVDLSEEGNRPNSVVVRLISDMVVEPHEKKYVTLHMQVENKDPRIIFIGDSYDDSHEEEKWFLYTEIQPDNINHKIVLLNLTNEQLKLKAGDELGVIESYVDYVEDGTSSDVPEDLGENIYTYGGLRIFDKNNEAKDVKFSSDGVNGQIVIEI